MCREICVGGSGGGKEVALFLLFPQQCRAKFEGEDGMPLCILIAD